MKSLKPILFALSMLVAASAVAVPAKREKRTYSQPDGSTVSLTLVGDEHSHYYITEDHQVVLRMGDGFYFAEINSEGLPSPSKVMAADPDKRTPAQTSFVRATDRAQMQTALRRKADMRRSVMRRSAGDTQGVGLFPGSEFPTTGNGRGLVILAEFMECRFRISDPKTYFTRQLNEEGFSDDGGTGSARDYFVEMSGGTFTPSFDVYGPVTLNSMRDYYGGNNSSGNDVRPAQMIKDACQGLDSQIDFSQYDFDGDGYVDNVFVIYAGEGEASSDVAEAVWPHKWDLISGTGSVLTLDGVKINAYACANEWEPYLSTGVGPNGIGTFVHEFSHVLGLPDEYNTVDTGTLEDAFWYSVMDNGSYNNDSRTPAAYSIFQRNALGWTTPKEITDPANITLGYSIATGDGCVISTGNPNEFFLLENRQNTGWDTYLPGHGMIIWHIDYDATAWRNNQPNGNDSHRRIRMVRANNGSIELTSEGYVIENSLWGFTFPGSYKVTAFTAETTPALATWAGAGIDLPITDITEKSGIITFKVLDGILATPDTDTPTDVGFDYFTAEWSAVRGASDYLVTVTYIDYDGETVSRAETVNIVDGYDGVSTSGATSLRVDNLVNGVPQYMYTVKAINPDNNVESAETEPVTVNLKTSMLGDITAQGTFRVSGRTLTAAGAPVAVHDIYGRRLASGVKAYTFPTPGIYIISAGNVTHRVVVK